ncbi:helix-turn-helix domain-containing protein [Dysgonomonas capnocytophagoides]|uniref:helix-turn-helix domain-containing protein n=1 Tax=Dysgonomonas capnocytophagoides TaxID=45254 RepID=UPI002923C4DB|nr:helix-turn-helix domain-containing protein [Dysgonomonas capnocytophagoides]
MENIPQHLLNSVTDLHYQLNLKSPANPLVSVVRLEDIPAQSVAHKTIVCNFYVVYLKKNYEGKVKYGYQYYDFDNGIISFFSPKQKITIEENNGSQNVQGWMLVFHPDFIQGYGLAKKMKSFNFFSYATNEALHISEKEENTISGILENLQEEIENRSDGFTQEVMVSHIELLLNYCNRFYSRQFITRKKASNDLLIKFEQLLDNYLNNEKIKKNGLPTVKYFADELNVSPNYLNDILKNLTGQTTQQHLHYQLVEKAKELLSTTELSVSEVAYQLGFEYTQSFNKLFKNKTKVTPLEFRQAFN